MVPGGYMRSYMALYDPTLVGRALYMAMLYTAHRYQGAPGVQGVRLAHVSKWDEVPKCRVNPIQ